MRIFPTNPDGVQDQRLRFHTFHTGRMAIRRKAKLKNRNLFFHMLPTHLRSPAKETRAKACLKKAFGLLFVTIQIHAKRKKGTGLFTMNILVVDDEYYIVKNIIETTDWSATRD